MEMFSATQAKQSFGVLMDTAQRKPVMIAKQGRPFAVMLSAQAYYDMQEKLHTYEKIKKAAGTRD